MSFRFILAGVAACAAVIALACWIQPPNKACAKGAASVSVAARASVVIARPVIVSRPSVVVTRPLIIPRPVIIPSPVVVDHPVIEHEVSVPVSAPVGDCGGTSSH